MKIYGLIGKKIGHSYSALFFNSKFEKEGIDSEYRLFPLPEISNFPELISSNPDIAGLNVTVPYKQEIIPYLSGLSEEAREIGAVNVIKFIRKGEKQDFIGYNSDAIGFQESLRPLLRPEMKEALVLGTGGASKAVEYVLKKFGIEVTKVSRNPDGNQISYADLTPELVKENLLIVNTTPVGMFPDIENYPDIPYQYLTSSHLCYDVIYNPEETEFLKRSKEQGAATKNGLEMLRLQAEKAWEIWNS